MDYDSDGIDIIPEEDVESLGKDAKLVNKQSSNLFTNLSNRGFEPVIKSNQSSPRRDTESPSTVVLSRCPTSDLNSEIFGSFPNTSDTVTSVLAESVVAKADVAISDISTSVISTSDVTPVAAPVAAVVATSVVASSIIEASPIADIMTVTSVVPAPTIPVTTIVTSSSPSGDDSGNTSEILVNTLVNDNQIVLAKKISILDLKIEDIENIEDKEARDWIVYGIHGMKTLLKVADHLKEHKIEFDIKQYVSQEFPPNLQYFDPLNTKDLVNALAGDLINDKLKQLDDQYRPLLSQRGKRTKQYDYLIPHKAAALRNTLLAVSVDKRNIVVSSLKSSRISKLVSDGSPACKSVRRDKVITLYYKLILFFCSS